MRRFFTNSGNISRDKIIIRDNSEVHHIRDVLRLKKGAAAIVCDDKGNEYKAAIESASRQNITLSIKEKRVLKPSQKIKITVACALPKMAKMDDIIDKLTQLGVQRIIPLNTARVIVKLDKLKTDLRLKRWERIAISASKQSQRSVPPVIEGVTDFKKVLAESKEFDLKIIPTLAGKRKTLREVFAGRPAKSVLALIGPEGDFSDEEVRSAAGAGFIPITLGELVLRVDTAAVAVAASIRFYEND